MLARIYIAVAPVLGSCVCWRFYRFTSLAFQLAASFRIGIRLSTCATYLFSLIFVSYAKPLVGANLLFFGFGGLVIYKLCPRSVLALSLRTPRAPGSLKWDAIFIGAFGAVACYLMFGTVSLKSGSLRLASVVWNDFGPNLSLMQSFAVGHNFPTEYPHFIGVPIRYHFLFWFQAGNLEFLGLNLAWALNLLSVLSLVAVVVLIMNLGENLFRSRAVGRIAACLFFLPSTLSYLPFLRSHKSLPQTLASIATLNHWLTSGYPYKAEDWGTWSLSIFYVQRHFLPSLGILLLVLGSFIEFYGRKRAAQHLPSSNPLIAAAENSTAPGDPSPPLTNIGARPEGGLKRDIDTFIFSGLLVGLLPFWNSAAFVAAFALSAGVFLLFPCRRYMIALLVTAAAVAGPQVWFLFLRGQGFVQQRPLIHWGLVVENPTVLRVVEYFCFTFGPKFLLACAALWLVRSTARRMFAAVFILPVLAFTTQLSTDIINNHKFLYIWIVIINVFVAFLLWRIGKIGVLAKVAAIVLALVVTLGGVIEWFRIHNDTTVDVPFDHNPLADWLQKNTKPADIFLTDRFVIHPILLNGRRIFYGWPYFGWSLGYPTAQRDAIYERILATTSPDELVRLLNGNGIRYVGIDNGLRSGPFKGELKEEVYQRHFEKVFEDTQNRFGSLTIYCVPVPSRNVSARGAGTHLPRD
jgi:hypothetical protein